MAKIIITDNYSSYNGGDAAILSGMVQSLKKRIPDAEFLVLSSFPEAVREVNKINGVSDVLVYVTNNRLRNIAGKIGLSFLVPLKGTFKMLRYIVWGFFRRSDIDFKWILNSKEHETAEAYHQADIIIGCGGGYINDNYKPAILGRLFNLWFGKFLGKPVMIYAQSLGPFNTRFYRFLSRYVFDNIDLITTRDVISKNILEDIGVTKTPVYANADAAILLEPSKGNGIEGILNDLDLNEKDKPIIGITVRTWAYGFENPVEVNERFMRNIAKFADYHVKLNKFKIVFFSTPINKGRYYSTDMDTVDEIVSMMKHKDKVKTIINKYSPSELKRICGQMDIVIGTRMHSSILSSNMGVPVIGIEYEFKIRDYLKSLGQEKYLFKFDDVTFEELRDMVDDVWKNRGGIKREMEISVKKLEEKALKNADLCAKLIENEQITYQ